MEFFYILIILINAYIIYNLIRNLPNTKKDIKRTMESKRYFNGSKVEKDNRTYTSGCFTEGLSAQTNGNKIVFTKQAKMCDTSLLY